MIAIGGSITDTIQARVLHLKPRTKTPWIGQAPAPRQKISSAHFQTRRNTREDPRGIKFRALPGDEKHSAVSRSTLYQGDAESHFEVTMSSIFLSRGEFIRSSLLHIFSSASLRFPEGGFR